MGRNHWEIRRGISADLMWAGEIRRLNIQRDDDQRASLFVRVSQLGETFRKPLKACHSDHRRGARED